MTNEWRAAPGFEPVMVWKMRTPAGSYTYTAWEPSAVMGRHYSITTVAVGGEDRWYGQIGAAFLGAGLDGLRGAARSQAIQATRKMEAARAFAAIRAAYPEAVDGIESSSAGIEIEWTPRASARA